MNLSKQLLSAIGAVMLLSLVSTFTGCDSDDVFGNCPGISDCGGMYSGHIHGIGGTLEEVRAEVDGGAISFLQFYAFCGSGPGSCSLFVTQPFHPDWVAPLDGGCGFTVTGQLQSNPGTLRIDGALDTESCAISGSFELNAGSCCSESGIWSAGR